MKIKYSHSLRHLFWFLAAAITLVEAEDGWAGNAVVELSDTVQVNDVLPFGINASQEHADFYWSNPMLKTNGFYNFEGVSYRQCLDGHLFTNGFASTWGSITSISNYNWRKVYSGATVRVISGVGLGHTTICTRVESKSYWYAGVSNHRFFLEFADPISIPVSPTSGAVMIDRYIDEGYVGKLGFWVDEDCKIVHGDNPPGVWGSSVLWMDGLADGCHYRVDASWQRYRNVNGIWEVKFWARAYSNTPVFTISTEFSDSYTTNVNLTTNWQYYTVPIPVTGVSEPSSSSDNPWALLALRVTDGSILLDNMSTYKRDPDQNGSPFLDRIVDMYKELNVGILRCLQIGGSSVSNTIFNGLRSYAHMNYVWADVGPHGGASSFEWGMHDWYELCEEVGVDPWYSIPGTIYPNEVDVFMEYIAGDTNTYWGAVRAELGHPEPWTNVFDKIYLEIGNEAWNTALGFLAGGYDGPDYWEEIFSRVKASPYYSSQIVCMAAGHSKNSSDSRFILDWTPSADRFAIAPYMRDRLHNEDVELYDEEADMFRWNFAESYQRVNERDLFGHGDNIKDRGKEMAIYEVNFHTTHDDGAPAYIRNKLVTSIGGALAVANAQLETLRLHNCRALCLFTSFGEELEGTRLWGHVLGVKTNSVQRWRPQGLLLKAINAVMGGNMVESSHGGDGLMCTVTGRFNSTSTSFVPEEYEFDQLRSFAFRDQDRRGLILINYDLETNHTVELRFPEKVLDERAQSWLVTAAAFTNNNEFEVGTNLQVHLITNTVNGFTNGYQFVLPPFSMQSFEWYTNGPLPRLEVSTTSVTVVEGQTVQFNVRLEDLPGGPIQVNLRRRFGDADISVSGPTSLTFNTSNYNTWQPVTVAAARDDDSLAGNAQVECITSDGVLKLVDVLEEDVDSNIEVLPSSLYVPENGTASFNIKLEKQPGFTTTVSVSRISGDTNLTLSGTSTFIFTASNWDTWQTVTLAASADDDLNEDEAIFRCQSGSQIMTDVTAIEDDKDITRLRVDADTYCVRSDSIDRSGETQLLPFNGWLQYVQRKAFIRFSATNLPDQLTSASLLLTVDTAESTASYTWSIYGLKDGHSNENWNASTITYSNSPAFSPEPDEVNTNEASLIGQINATLTPADAGHTYQMEDIHTNSLREFLEANTNDWVTFIFILETRIDMAQEVFWASSEHGSYNGPTLKIIEDKTYRITTDTSHMTVDEGSTNGLGVRFTGTLDATRTVVVSRVSGDSDIRVVSAPLVFTTNNWDTWQYAQIAVVQDGDQENGTATIQCTSIGIPDKEVTVTEVDDDVPQIALSTNRLTVEEGHSNSISLRLTLVPAGTATVLVSRLSGDVDLTVVSGSYLFTTNNWDTWQPVLIAAAPDGDVTNGVATFTCSSAFAATKEFLVTEEDSEEAFISLSVGSLTVNEGETNTFDVRLTHPPEAVLTVDVSRTSGDTSLAVASALPLLFSSANWDTWQTVEVAAAQDADDADGSGVFECVGPRLVGASITVTLFDDDDVTAPSILNVEALLDNSVTIEFSEEVLSVTANNVAHYHINNGINVLAAAVDGGDGSIVNLTVSPMIDGAYTLTVNNIQDLFGNTVATNTSALFSYSSGPNVFYSEPLDTDPGWTTEDLWAFGEPQGGGGQYGNPDPASAYTGTNVYGYNLSGDYQNSMASTKYLTTDAIDCSSHTNVTLVFERWLNVEMPTYDHAYIEASSNGTDWVVIWENSATITDSAWLTVSNSLSAVADEQPTVYIRWGMGVTDSGWKYSGWNIDDVRLQGTVARNSPVLTTNELYVTEGQTNLLGIHLRDPVVVPTTVTVARASGDTDLSIAGNTSFVFDVGNWNSNQWISIAAADDADSDNGSASFSCSAPGLGPKIFTVWEVDDDLAIHVQADTLYVPEGAIEPLQIRLNNQPPSTATVTVSRISGDTNLIISGSASLTFTTGNWDTWQAVNIQSTPDADSMDGSTLFRCTSPGLSSQDVTAYEQETPRAFLPFLETWESGSFSNYWSIYSDPNGQVQLSTSWTPYEGARHVLLDTQVNSIYALNELTLTVDLSGKTNVQLKFYGKDFGDELESMSSSFSGRENSDGVAVSVDGTNWYRAMTLGMPSTVSYDQYVLDLDSIFASNAIGYQTYTYIKFQQYDNYSISSDGFAFDYIEITGSNDVVNILTDTPEITIPEGGSNTLQVRLSEEPVATSTVMVSRISGDPDITVVSGSTLIFSTSNWDTWQPVVLAAAEDGDTLHGTAAISLDISFGNDRLVTAVEQDNDQAICVSTNLLSIPEGETRAFNVRLNTEPPADTTVAVTRISGDSDLSITGPASLVFSPSTWDTWQSITIAAAMDSDYINSSAVFRCSSAAATDVDITVWEWEVPRAEIPFLETWESGVFSNYWSRYSTATGRIQLLTAQTPYEGSYHVVMDAEGAGYSLNELTLAVNLEEWTNVMLDFWWEEYGDETHAMSASFTGHENSDGVAVSVDGTNWYRVVSLASTLSDTYTQQTLNLDAIFSSNGIGYRPYTYIKFQQYDNYPIYTDGFAFDYISLTGNVVTLHMLTDKRETAIAEGGETNFLVKLSEEPLTPQTVTVSRTAGDTDIAVSGGATLMFTTSNWDTWQSVTLNAQEDADWLAGTATVQCTSADMPSLDITVIESDNDFDPTYSLPWVETFEASPTNMAGTPGDLNGQNGWVSTPLDAGQVSTEAAREGTQSCRIVNGSVAHDFHDAKTNITITFFTIPAMGSLNPSPDNASAVCMFNSNGNVVAYSGSVAMTSSAVYPTAGWRKVQMHLDYGSQTWDLLVDDTNVFSDLAFYMTHSAFSQFSVANRNISTAFIDNVHISMSSNADDTDGDGIPDDWEQVHAGNLEMMNNDTDSDGDGILDIDEYIGGTQPTNSASYLMIAELKNGFGPTSGNVLQWDSVSGRLYHVYWTTSLINQYHFEYINSNLPARPPINVWTDNVPHTENSGFYRIGVELE